MINKFAPLFIAFWSITQVGKDIQWLRKTALPNEDRMKDMNWMKRYPFYQHFTSSFLVQKCFAKLFSTYCLTLHFLAKEYWHKNCS